MDKRLAEAGKRFAEATAARDEARRQLYAAVRAAHKTGMSMRRIAELAGVSFQRVHQVIHGK